MSASPLHPRLARLPRPSVVEWLCLAVGVSLTLRYAWFLDDAFVYFRYADNALYLGHGLVYNAGEYVEGYSSPLWMMLVLVLRSTGMNYWVMVRGLGLLCFVLSWVLLVLLNRKLAPATGPGGPRVNVPLCYLSANYAVMSYFTSGTESALVQVAAIVYALLLVDPSRRFLQIMVAATPLLRPEMVLPLGVCWAVIWVRTRRFPWLLTAVSSGLGSGWLLFRIIYYADLFPNTYHLKDTVDIRQGLVYLWDTTSVYHLFALLGLAGGGLFLATRRSLHTAGGRRGATERVVPAHRLLSGGPANGDWFPRLLMLAAAIPTVLYVIKIGGDPRHYRYLAFPFCLAVCATAGVGEHLLARLGRRHGRALGVVAGVAVALASFAFYPRQLLAHPITGDGRHRMVDRINDAGYHRHHPTLAAAPLSSGRAFEQRSAYAAWTPADHDDPYEAVHVSGWCVTHYRRFDARIVHSLGLTDAVLARTRVSARRSGHKTALIPLARDLAEVYRSATGPPGRGMFRRAVATGVAAAWMVENLDTLEVIEQQIFNEHRFFENVALAMAFPPRVEPGTIRRGRDPRRRGPPDRSPGREPVARPEPR